MSLTDKVAALDGAARRRIDAAMLESLAGTFRILNDGGPFVCSFNYGDVADLLQRSADIVGPALQAMGDRRG